MNKKFYFKLFLTLFVSACTLSCNRFDEKEILKMTPSSLQMQLGETAIITVEIFPEPVYASVIMGVSKPNVIEIFDSDIKKIEIKAIGVGDVTFSAQYGSKRSECKVTVKE
jgi:hypothetical protein